MHLPIVMPPEGTYHAYIDVFTGGLRFLAYQATEDVIIAEPFPGFSLRVTGTWAPLWFAQIGNYQLTNETSPWIPEGLGQTTVRIVCLDSDYSCPASDPICEGKEWDVLLEDGHNYILNASTGELSEDPNPPAKPVPSVQPHVLETNLPPGPVSETVLAGMKVYLPKRYMGLDMQFQPQLVLGYQEVVIAGILTGYIPTEMVNTFNGPSLPMKPYLPLDSPDNIYDLPGLWNPGTLSFGPAKLSYFRFGRTRLVPPGKYSVEAVIKYYHCFISGGEGFTTSPQGELKFGTVGLIEVI